MNSFLITCFLIIISILTEGLTDCPQCFDSMRTQMSSSRRVFRLKNSSLPLNPRSFRNSDHLLDEHVIDEEPEPTESSTVLSTESHPSVNNNYRIRPVFVPQMNRNQRQRSQRRFRPNGRTSTTTTTTTSTTTPAVDDYYEYEDDYDDDYVDYQLTTTTTTTTTRRPQHRRRGGRRRFRRPTEPPTTTTTTTLSPNYKHRPDGRIIDYLADPNFPYELKGADLTEYPFYISIPETTFNCKGRTDGYYANIDLMCQVYHHCATGHQRYDFLCPNYTLFDQTTFTCRFINSVECNKSENHYHRNNELYLISTTTTASIPNNNATQK